MSKDGKLPLPDGFFKVPELSSGDHKHLLSLAKRACKEVVYYSRLTGGPMKWVPLPSSDENVELFQGLDESTTSDDHRAGLTYLRGATKIHATIDEITDFFRLDTPEKLRGFAQTVGKDVLDQQTLFELAGPTPENPKHYVGVKWTAVESPSSLARDRDFCYLECHDEFIDTTTQRRGWARSIHSIRVPSCPPLDKSHGLVRGSLYRSGFIFLESADGSYVEAIHTLHLDIKGNSPSWLKVLVMKRRIHNISQVNKYFQTQRLVQGKLLGDLELPVKDRVSRCQRCDTRFGIFHRKWRCRKCGNVVCSNCSAHFILDYANVGMRKVRICEDCSTNVTVGTDSSYLDSENSAYVVSVPAEPTKAQKCQGADVRPIYDTSPAVSGEFSLEEQNYYLQNEDDRGLADMAEAKRMQREFENHLKRSSAGLHDSGHTTASTQHGDSPQAEVPLGAWPLPDTHDDDDELGLPLSKREQQRLEKERQVRQERLERTQQQSKVHAAVTASYNHRHQQQTQQQQQTRQNEMVMRSLSHRTNSSRDDFDFEDPSSFVSSPAAFSVRRDSLDSICVSSDWGNEKFAPMVDRTDRRVSISTSTWSENVGAPIHRRSDASVDSNRPSLHRKHSASSSAGRRWQSPSPSFRSSGQSDFLQPEDIPLREQIRRQSSDLQSYHSSSSSRRGSAQDSRRQYENGYEVPSRLYRSRENSRHSDDRELRDRSYENSNNSFHRQRHGTPSSTPNGDAGTYFPSSRRSSQDQEEQQQLAHHLAVSAMRMYESERGPQLYVSDETRQTALDKMIAIYAREIERSNSSGSSSQTPDSHPVPLQRRKTEEVQQQFSYQSSLVSSGVGLSPSDRRSALGQQRSERFKLSQRHGNSTDARESLNYSQYRDLSDLTSTAFQEYQKSSEGIERPSAAGGRPTMEEPLFVPKKSGMYQRTNSFIDQRSLQHTLRDRAPSGSHMEALGEVSDARSRAMGTMHGSVASSSDFRTSIATASRRNSIHDEAESDTFSEMDLIDLPHLMRKEDHVARASLDREDFASRASTSTSFADVHQWQEAASSPHGSIGYEDLNRRLQEQLQLHLRDDDDDDSVFANEDDLPRAPVHLDERPRAHHWSVVSDDDDDEEEEVETIGSPTGVLETPAYEPQYSEYPVFEQSPIVTFSTTGSGSGSDSASDSSSSSEEADFAGAMNRELSSNGQHPPDELERYRASLSELLSVYSSDHESSPLGQTGKHFFGSQPESEPDLIYSGARSPVPDPRRSRPIPQRLPTYKSGPRVGSMELYL